MQSDRLKFKIDFKKRLYQFALDLIKFINSLPQNNQSSKIIGNQLLRSGTSITANYIESSAANSRRDFILFFTHALKSANESKFWLALLRDSGISDKTKIDPLLQEVNEIANVLASSILTLKGRK